LAPMAATLVLVCLCRGGVVLKASAGDGCRRHADVDVAR